jgi:hypothetical protein
MRTISFFLLIAAAAIAQAQNYSIDWFTIDGGGGTSTGGVYALSGTIGQPDAGTMTGGSYSLNGGFWSIFAIQAAGSPRLSVSRSGNSVIVSWPAADATDFILDRTSTLTGSPAIPWGPAPETYSTNNGVISITIPSPNGIQYYRLRKP